MECFDGCILVYAYVTRDITVVGNAFWGWGGETRFTSVQDSRLFSILWSNRHTQRQYKLGRDRSVQFLFSGRLWWLVYLETVGSL